MHDSPRTASADASDVSVSQVWPRAVRALHWVTALLLTVGIAAVLAHDQVEGHDARAQLMNVHRQAGLLILLLVVIRIGVRLRTDAPRWLQSAPAKFAALATHLATYLLMIGLPVMGWLLTNAKGKPVALLGLRDRENLFVDEAGKWDGRYVPAFVRRYPFVLADNGNGEFIVCVDEASPAFNAADGQAMFDEGGKNTPFLDNALNFLNAYQAQFARTEAFVKRLQELDLFTQMSAKTELTDGRSFVLNQLFIVDEQKLLQLDDKVAADLLKSGHSAWIYAHLMSLSNMSRLVDRISDRNAPVADDAKVGAAKPAAAASTKPAAPGGAKKATEKA